MRDDKHEFKSGAKSSVQKPRYDLIPLHSLSRIATRFGEGAEKYGENNWQKGLGDREFLIDRINHAIEHLFILKDRVAMDIMTPGEDDDAAAVVLNAIFIMEAQDDSR